MENKQITENQLQIIVKESGLEATKAQVMLTNFQDYFKIAAEWEARAKTIIVTDESQKVDMQLARTGRLYLREKRIAIENTRKKLKEQALREGKAIDGIANVLKALILPIENYLDTQEHFAEIRAAEKDEQERIKAEQKAEENRIAKEKAEAEERERIRKENERLKAEAIERERLAEIERKKQAEILAKEKARAEAEKQALEEKARKEREIAETKRKEAESLARKKQEAIEAKARAEKEKQTKKLEAQRKKAEAERLKAETERKEKERLAKILENQIECPYCHRKFDRGTI